MKIFFFKFFLILSPELISGYTEKFTHPDFRLSKILSSKFLTTRKIACETDDECQRYILNSECNKVCQCTPGNVLISDASKCLPPAKQYGSPCEDNIQCSHLLSVGGVCQESRCICKTGFHYLKGVCWKNVELHEKCYRDEECFSDYEYVGFECKNNKCECRAKYYERLSSGCRRKSRKGDPCNIDADCIDQSMCEQMKCSPSTTMKFKKIDDSYKNFTDLYKVELVNSLNCPKGKFEFNNTCVLELGMECTTDSDCHHIGNALCLDNFTCACQPVLYVASEDNRQCLRVPRGKVENIQRVTCKKNPECGVFGGNSFCQNKKCACTNGTYFEKESSFCWTIRPLNKDCRDNRDCYPSGTHADCVKTESGKLCTCQKGYHQNGLECFPDALEVGDLCKNNEDCFFPNSFCNESNVCTCKERHYLENGKCFPGVGTSCVKDSDCAHLSNTKCKMQNSSVKHCLCLENYTESENYKYCLPNANYKENCTESFQCKFPMGDQGQCKNNICECPEEEHYLDGKCYISKFVGEACSSLSECFTGSDNNSVICLKGFCSCNYDYELHNSKICVKANSATKASVYFMPLMILLLLLAVER